VDIASGEQRSLTPFEKTRVQIVGISSEVKDRILVGVNNRDPKWHDVHSLDLKTAADAVMMNTGGYAGFLADEQLRSAARASRASDGGSDFYRVCEQRRRAQPFEQSPLRIPDHPPRWFHDRRKTCTGPTPAAATLPRSSLRTWPRRQEGRGAERPADIGGACQPKTGRLEAYGVNYLKNEWVPVDAMQ
jgi:hypothetical protein